MAYTNTYTVNTFVILSRHPRTVKIHTIISFYAHWCLCWLVTTLAVYPGDYNDNGMCFKDQLMVVITYSCTFSSFKKWYQDFSVVMFFLFFLKFEKNTPSSNLFLVLRMFWSSWNIRHFLVSISLNDSKEVVRILICSEHSLIFFNLTCIYVMSVKISINVGFHLFLCFVLFKVLESMIFHLPNYRLSCRSMSLAVNR